MNYIKTFGWSWVNKMHSVSNIIWNHVFLHQCLVGIILTSSWVSTYEYESKWILVLMLDTHYWNSCPRYVFALYNNKNWCGMFPMYTFKFNIKQLCCFINLTYFWVKQHIEWEKNGVGKISIIFLFSSKTYLNMHRTRYKITR